MVSRAEKDRITHGPHNQSPFYQQIHFHQITLKMAADDMAAKL